MYVINQKTNNEINVYCFANDYQDAKNKLNKYIEDLNCPQKIIKEKDSFKLLSTNGNTTIFYIQKVQD